MAKRRKKSNTLKLDFLVKDGYIFYDRLNYNQPNAVYWNKIGKTADKDLKENIELLKIENDREKLADMLLAQSKIEHEKEKNFLEKVFEIDTSKIDLDDYPTLINKLNELIGLKDDYKYLLTVLKEGRGKTEVQKKTARGYGAAAYFDGYLAGNLSKRISNAMRNQKNIDIILSGNDIDYDNFIIKIIDKSIEDTIKQISQNEHETIDNEDIYMWKNAIKLLEKTEEVLYGRFKSDLYKKFNLDDTKEQIRIFLRDKLSSSKKLRGLRTTIKDSYTMQTKDKKEKERYMRGAEGFLEEYLQAVLSDNIIIGLKGAAATRQGTVFKSNIAKTDTISLYSTNINFDLQPLIDELNSQNHFENLMETQNYLNSFNDKLQSMPDNFVVYESVKKYATNSDNFRGFGGGVSRVKDLPMMFNKTNTEIDVEKLITTLLNTMTGAIHEKNKNDRKEISYQLSASVATFLFDDWESIGNITTDNVLHIFILDSVRIPLSYLLYAIATAIREVNDNPTSIIKFSYSLGSILYPDPIGRGKNDEPFDKKGGMQKYWEEQRIKAREQATFSTHFLQNFNKIISNLIKQL